MITEQVKQLDPPAPTPSLQEIQAPTISYKDRQALMWLYDGKLRKAEKLRRLVRLGYAQPDDKGEIIPTLLGSLIIDYTVRQREKANLDRKRKPPTPPRKSRVNTFGARKHTVDRTIPVGIVSLGDSGEVVVDTEPSIEPAL